MIDAGTRDGAAGRRDPESFLRLIRSSRRGKLRVYLGYAPGVGKTYQMLLEAQRLKDQGADVVLGYVEDHGRPDTQSLCLGLEAVPRRIVEYRGIRLEEMDLDAVLARKPEVAVVDELAHTNAPGGRHGKRWQDVLELQDHGVNVLTTVNVQHLESLYETVGGLVGVAVKERVPDWVVAEADQVVNVDLAVDDLHQRLREGKVYREERVPAALANFFRGGNLAQLRELTLREAAAQAQRQGAGRAEGKRALFAPDQVMVCLSSKGPDAASLLRYGSRLAGRLDRNWLAVYVRTPDEEPERLDATTQRQLADTLELAQQLGATVYTLRGDEVVGAVLRFARDHGVGHVVVGRPGRLPLWRRLLGRRGPVRELLERAAGLTVVVTDPEGPAPAAQAGEVAVPEASVQAPEGVEPVPLASILDRRAILVLDARPAKEELVDLLLERLMRLHPRLDGAMALRRLRRREREASTSLGGGLALPHARIPGLPRPLAALALVGDPGDAAGDRVTLLLLLPEDRPQQALDLMGAVARVFRERSAIDELARARTGEEAAAVWHRLASGAEAREVRS